MHEHRGLPVTDPSELATTGDDGNIDIDTLAPLSPLTKPGDPADTRTATAELDDDSGQEVFLDGLSA